MQTRKITKTQAATLCGADWEDVQRLAKQVIRSGEAKSNYVSLYMVSSGAKVCVRGWGCIQTWILSGYTWDGSDLYWVPYRCYTCGHERLRFDSSIWLFCCGNQMERAG